MNFLKITLGRLTKNKSDVVRDENKNLLKIIKIEIIKDD